MIMRIKTSTHVGMAFEKGAWARVVKLDSPWLMLRSRVTGQATVFMPGSVQVTLQPNSGNIVHAVQFLGFGIAGICLELIGLVPVSAHVARVPSVIRLCTSLTEINAKCRPSLRLPLLYDSWWCFAYI